MEEQIFTDGIGRISIIGGVVRLDLMTYSATETDAKGQPRAILTQRLVMGTDGFLKSSEKILEAAQKMTRQAAPQKASASAAAAQPRMEQPRPEQPRAEQPRVEKPAPVAPPPAPMSSPWSAPLVPKRPFP